MAAIGPNNNNEAGAMSPAERAKTIILLVESDANDRNNLRLAIKSLGYGGFTDAPNHAMALEKLAERKVTHIIFEAKKTNMPAKEFLHKVLEADPTVVALPSSYEPQIDDVFDLLVMGARGYIVKPFTSDTLESAMVQATKGEPISEAVLNAKDRNEALVALTMASLDKAATVLRQAGQFETAKREIPKSINMLRRSAELAKTFCKGGEEGLLEAIEKFCLERSKGPATKLGRLRQRLRTTRSKDEDEGAGEETTTEDSNQNNDSNGTPPAQ
jgi:DNA-binding NarL/FixJ family response regulator